MKTAKSISYLALAVTSYMLVALIWWAILLNRQNAQINDLLHTEQVEIESRQEVYNFERKQKMILGEAIVFGLALVIGMWLIYRSYNQQVGIERNKSNFLLAVTHELRSPLTGISLNLETLKRKLNLDPPLAKSLHYAQLETKRLEVLIENLLQSANDPTSSQSTNSILRVEQLIEDLLSSHFPTGREILLSVSGQPKSITLDKSKAISIFQNLIDNACKYTPDGKAIKIEVIYGNDSLDVHIIDQAPTIPKDQIGNIFGKFYRLGDENTREQKGVGLGLYIVKKLLNQIDGAIRVVPYPGGNDFVVTIPYPNTLV